MTRTIEQVEVGRIFLYEENPRHEPIETEPEIIQYLCRDESVYNLARSISEAGLNPLESVGLVELPGKVRENAKRTYQCWEGNRRICAIKLLNDPDLAPPELRKDFVRLASSSGHVPIKKVSCVIFDDHDDLKFWMGILHDGEQSGVGRRGWDSAQKARHFGTSRNKVALAVLDAAEALKIITKDERAGRITTAQRYLNRSIIREALGIDASNLEDITFTRPIEDLKKQLGRFFSDMKEQKVNSRQNSANIDAYGRTLAGNPAISGERISPHSLSKAAAVVAKSKLAVKAKPRRPPEPTHIEFDKALSRSLERVASAKLVSLYYSICAVSFDHVPLLTIGVWAFIESLAARAGKNTETDFVAFFSNHKMSELGLGSGRTLNPIRDALTRVQRNGNATKHHEIAATFDGKQLANDVATITPLLLKTVDSIALKK